MIEMRRPSGNADVAEWEEMVSYLENMKLTLEKENEKLEQENSDLSKGNLELQEVLKRRWSKLHIVINVFKGMKLTLFFGCRLSVP